MQVTFKIGEMNPGITAQKGITYSQYLSHTVCFMCGAFQLMLYVC